MYKRQVITTLAVYDQLDQELINIADVSSNWIKGDIESMGGLNSDALATANVTMLVISSDKRTIPPPGTATVLRWNELELEVARTQTG